MKNNFVSSLPPVVDTASISNDRVAVDFQNTLQNIAANDDSTGTNGLLRTDILSTTVGSKS